MSSKFYNKVTEAMQWDGTVEGYAQLCQWVTSFCDQYDLSIQDLSQGLPGASPVVVGLDMSPAAANLVVHSGDYVIRNMRSRPHAVQRDDFERTYGPSLTDQQIEACAAALAGRLTDKVPQHMKEAISYTEHAFFGLGKTGKGALLVMWSDDTSN